MLEFLPDVIPAIQEADLHAHCFDNPSVEYHKVALKHYDREEERRTDPEFACRFARSPGRDDRTGEALRHACHRDGL